MGLGRLGRGATSSSILIPLDSRGLLLLLIRCSSRKIRVEFRSRGNRRNRRFDCWSRCRSDLRYFLSAPCVYNWLGRAVLTISVATEFARDFFRLAFSFLSAFLSLNASSAATFDGPAVAADAVLASPFNFCAFLIFSTVGAETSGDGGVGAVAAAVDLASSLAALLLRLSWRYCCLSSFVAPGGRGIAATFAARIWSESKERSEFSKFELFRLALLSVSRVSVFVWNVDEYRVVALCTSLFCAPRRPLIRWNSCAVSSASSLRSSGSGRSSVRAVLIRRPAAAPLPSRAQRRSRLVILPSQSDTFSISLTLTPATL